MEPKFIHRKKYAEKLGVTDRIIEGWMFEKWNRGQHYVVVGKQTLVNIPEVDKWLISQQELNHTEKA
tara:strand:+ start:162 stop:362 length:201 start_codon:yes stop_codon:yes gene_type:complete